MREKISKLPEIRIIRTEDTKPKDQLMGGVCRKIKKNKNRGDQMKGKAQKDQKKKKQ